MSSSRVKTIKHAQKEKILYRELSQFFLQLTLDHPELRELTLTRVKISVDKSLCTVYFYTPLGPDHFEHYSLDVLKIYKPSIRKALAQKIPARYTPDIRFAFDDRYEKQQRLEDLMQKISSE